jgi:hypothetical protein
MPRREEAAGGRSWWRNVGGSAPSANGRLLVVAAAGLVLAVLAILQSGPVLSFPSPSAAELLWLTPVWSGFGGGVG